MGNYGWGHSVAPIFGFSVGFEFMNSENSGLEEGQNAIAIDLFIIRIVIACVRND